MKSILLLILGISCFASFGNSQDSVEALPYGPAATAYNTQGSVAYNRTQADRELARAAAEAREQKELMYSRAAQSGTPPPPPPRTAAEFLAANKPPPAPPSNTPRPPIRTGRDYVPPFEGTASRPAPEPAAGLPKREGGFFKLFQSKKKNNAPVFEAPVGASEYQNPSNPEGIAAGDETSVADSPPESPAAITPNPEAMDAALRDATLNEGSVSIEEPVGNGKPGFFSKLFGRKKPAGADTPPVAASTPPTGSVASDAPAPPPPPASNEIPDPVSFTEPAPPAPAAETPSQPAPIFQRRSGGTTAGTPASMVRDGSATVNGVKVKLYEGGNVSVLSSGDGISRIQLPDGRIGTVSSSYLSQ